MLPFYVPSASQLHTRRSKHIGTESGEVLLYGLLKVGKDPQPLLMSRRTAILTLSTQRLVGRSCALRLAEDGCDLAICDDLSKQSELSQLKCEIESKGVKCCSYTCDQSNEEDVKNLISNIVEDLGGVDIASLTLVDAFCLLRTDEMNRWLLLSMMFLQRQAPSRSRQVGRLQTMLFDGTHNDPPISSVHRRLRQVHGGQDEEPLPYYEVHKRANDQARPRR